MLVSLEERGGRQAAGCVQLLDVNEDAAGISRFARTG